MIRGQVFDAIKDVNSLEVERLLRPERTVIVKSGNPHLRWNEIAVLHISRPSHEVDDRLLDRSVSPGGQGISCL